jgi:hypothetical protein
MHATRDAAAAVQHGLAELDMEVTRVPVGNEAIGPADAAVEVRMGNRGDLQAGAREHAARARLQNVRQRAVGTARCRQRPWRDRQLDGAGRLAEARICDDDSLVGARPTLHAQERNRHGTRDAKHASDHCLACHTARPSKIERYRRGHDVARHHGSRYLPHPHAKSSRPAARRTPNPSVAPGPRGSKSRHARRARSRAANPPSRGHPSTTAKP